MFLAGAAGAQVPVKDFVRKSDFGFAKISPTGEYLAVTKPHDDTMDVVVINLKDMKFNGAVTFKRGESAHDFWWASPTRIVVALAITYGQLDQPTMTGELMAMNADGSNRQWITGSQRGWTFLVDPLDEDDVNISAILLDYERGSRDPAIIKINDISGYSRRIATLPGYGPIDVAVDKDGEPQFGYSSGKSGEMNFFRPGPNGKGWKFFPNLKRPDWVTLYTLGSDGKSAFVSDQEESPTTCLREFLLETSSWRNVSCNERVDVGDVTFSIDGRRPVSITYEDGKPSVVYPDPEHPDARMLRSLRNAFKGQRVDLTSETRDGTKAVVLVRSDRNPGDFYLYDKTAKKAQYLISRQSWINPAQMSPMEPVTYTTRDGAAVSGYLLARDGLATKSAPLVLMPHGGPHGIRDDWGWEAWSQLLANRGYAVLQVNYRGSGGYGHEFQEAGYKKWGTLMQDDLTDAVKWAIAQGFADPKRICIMGASYGGYAAVRSAEREPDLYKCAVSFAGVYDLVTEYKKSDTSDSLYGARYWAQVQGDEATQIEQSPVTHVADLKVPVLIAHGTADRRVPFSQAKELRDALKKANKPFEWMEFDGEEHGFWKDENHEAFLTKVLAFLNQNIGPGTAVPAAAPATPPAK